MDKRVAAVDAEIERFGPLVDLGGYVPCPDHRIWLPVILGQSALGSRDRQQGGSMLKARLVYVTVCVCVAAMIIGIFAWIWRAAGRQDATSRRRGLTGQLMGIKTQAMADLRDGLATADYGRLEDGIARLRRVNAAAGRYLPEDQYGEAGAIFRRNLEQFGSDVERREVSGAKRSFEELIDSCVACHQTQDMPLDEDLKLLRK